MIDQAIITLHNPPVVLTLSSMCANSDEIIEKGRRILEEEGKAVLQKASELDQSFSELVRKLLELEGRVALTGVGKSGTIGEKIAATLSSTGTPAFYLRTVDALHGDLGMLTSSDVLLAISNSGETSEVLAVSDAASQLGVEIIALTGNRESSLGKLASLTIDTGVEREACPLGLAPTASTTVTLALGDALAMTLLEERNFTAENYAHYHPGGNLGQRLRYQVRDILRSGDELPSVTEEASLSEAIAEMTDKGNLGVTLVIGSGGELSGILSDGDLRRILIEKQSSSSPMDLGTPVAEVMTREPLSIDATASAKDALQIMEVHGITSLVVLNPLGKPEGMIHLHDILGRGKIVL